MCPALRSTHSTISSTQWTNSAIHIVCYEAGFLHSSFCSIYSSIWFLFLVFYNRIWSPWLSLWFSAIGFLLRSGLSFPVSLFSTTPSSSEEISVISSRSHSIFLFSEAYAMNFPKISIVLQIWKIVLFVHSKIDKFTQNVQTVDEILRWTASLKSLPTVHLTKQWFLHKCTQIYCRQVEE